MNKRVRKYKDFIESDINENGADLINLAMSGMTKTLGKLKENPSQFLQALTNIIKNQDELPGDIEDEFNKSAETQLDSIDNLYDISPRLQGSEKKAEAIFNRKSEEERESEEKIAQIQVKADAVIKPDFNKMGNYKYDNSNWSEYKRSTYIDLLKDKRILSRVDLKEWNLIGLRNNINVRKRIPNGFIDAIVLLPPEGSGIEPEIFEATTFPGPAFRVAAYRAWWVSRQYKWLGVNPANKGVAIMQPGIYEFKVDGKVLRPTKGVKVERYSIVKTTEQATSFNDYTPGNGEINNYSILIHSAKGSKRIDNWSSGCQVIKNASDLDKIVKTVSAKSNGKIKYILINT